MYQTLAESQDPVVGYEVRGELDEADLEAILSDLERVIDEYGEARLLVVLPEIPQPSLDALEEDLGFWMRHADELERYAVVGDGRLLEWTAKLGDAAVDTDLRHFEESDLDDAWNWAKAGTDAD